MRNAYNTVVHKPEGKLPLGKCTGRWEDNIKMDLKRNRVRGYELDSNGSG
jgi:hypothetical protein